MTANPIWIAAYGKAVAGAAPVWIAPGDGSVPSAVASWIAAYGGPVAGASPVWIAGYGGPVTGATPITLVGFGGSGGSGGGGTTSVWSAADAAANGMTLSNGGLTVAATTAATWLSIRGTTSHTSGKWYYEVYNSAPLSVGNGYNVAVGGGNSTMNIASYPGATNYSFAYDINGGGFVPILMGTGSSSNTVVQPSPVPNEVFAVAIDLDAGLISILRNNVLLNSAPLMSYTPANIANAPIFPALGLYDPGNGAWTLQSTAASQKYAPPSGFTAWDSGTAPSASDAYLARTVGGNEGGNGANIKTLIDGLVADGVWAKLDCLYVLAQQNATDALLNLVGTSHTAVNSGGGTFTTYKGFSGLSGDGLNTDLDPSAGGFNYTQNSAVMGVWVYAVSGSNSGVDASLTTTNNTLIVSNYNGGNVFFARINDSNGPSVPTPGTKGLFVGDRSSSSATVPYWNGTAQATVTSPSSALVGGNIFAIGYANAFGSSVNIISAAFIGASLGSAGQLALYNRLRTYMTAVGVP